MLGTVAAAAFVTTPALAARPLQQTTQEAAATGRRSRQRHGADDEGQDTATGDIVVTARRTEERLQRVPASVSAFNERALDRIQATDTTGLQGAVPNLNIVQGRGSSNATNIYIRGIGQPDALQTFDPAVGVYVDDVYLSRIRGTQLDLLDIERIEVLRGPQGTLRQEHDRRRVQGRHPQAGPGTPRQCLGRDRMLRAVRVQAAVSGPLTKTLSARRLDHPVEARRLRRNAIHDRQYNDRDTMAVRGALAFTPTDRLRMDITADYARTMRR